MYAAQFTQGKRRFDPAGMGAALMISGGMLAALMFAAPDILPYIEDPFLNTYSVPLTQPPPEPRPKPDTDAARSETKITVPDRRVDVKLPGGPDVDVTPGPPGPLPTDFGTGGSGTGTGTAEPPAPPLPVVTAAEIDPRYRSDFQPDYPAYEQRAGMTGIVVVRVLVGTNGRVRAVESVRATSDRFLDATRRRALARWRFRPATRDGVAVEAWREMTVRFVLPD